MGEAIESIYQDSADAWIAKIVGLKILSDIAALVTIQLEDSDGLIVALYTRLQ